MKLRNILIGIATLVLATGAFWAFHSTTATVAVPGTPHAGHAHGDAAAAPADAHDEDLNALFSDEDHDEHATNDDHAGHGHGEETAPRAAQQGHAGHGHEGHGHEGNGGLCPEHRVPEERDALCHGDHLSELLPGEGLLVRLASPESAARAGVEIRKAESFSLAEGLTLPGRVEYDRNRLAQLTPLAPGVVRRVLVQPGARVEKGTLLAELAIPDVALLKGELLAAEARREAAQSAYEREQDLLARGISSRQEFEQAAANYREARSMAERNRQQLLDFGLSPADLQRLQTQEDGSPLTGLRAPFAGTIVRIGAAAGETVAPGIPLLTLARLDPLWVELAIPESRIAQVRPGMAIEARFDGLPGHLFSGRLFQVGTELDPRTRTLQALAELQNPEQRLKVGMFGTVRLLGASSGERRPAVPAAAVQTIDGRPYLFVRTEPDLFELRRVETGTQVDGLVPILTGLVAGEPVVTRQGFALKSEVLKARLGASCADH